MQEWSAKQMDRKIVKLRSLIEGYNVKNKSNRNIPVYSVTQENGFCTGYFNKDVTGNDKTTYKIVPRGYFAYNPLRMNIGSVDWQNVKDEVLISSRYVVFRLSDDIMQQYLFYYLKSDHIQYLINERCRGSVRPELTIEILKTFDIEIVPKNEQLELIKKLDTLNKLIRSLHDGINLYDKTVKSRFIEMFGDCEKIPLTSSASINMGQSPDSSSYNDIGEGLPFYQGKADFGDVFVTVRDYCSDPKKIAYPMDVLMSVRAPVGTVNITKEKCCIGRGLASITPLKGRTTTRFLFTSLKLIESEIAAMGVGSTFKAINKEHMKKIMIPDADLSDQQAFDIFVKEVDKSKFEDYAMNLL
jgi:type I restriction enzyme S subunit